MNLHPKLERFLMTSCDQFFSAFPQKRPAKKLLEDCLIISHRGIHDQREIKENTMEAFKLAEEKGVYGIELDFRWTRDLVWAFVCAAWVWAFARAALVWAFA